MVIALPLLLILGGLLAISALCSATEAAILSINKVRLRHLVEQGNRNAKLTFSLLTQLDQVIGTLLIANSLVNVAISAITSWVFINHFGMEHGLAIATFFITAVLLVVGEVTPKMFGANYAEAVMFMMAAPLKLLMTILHPFAVFFTWVGRALLSFLRVPVRRRLPLVTEEEIKVMIQMGREAGVLAEEELRLLQRIFEFSDSLVGEAMVARNRIVGVDLASEAMSVLDVLIEEGYSRIPVYQGSLDKIIGVVHARDVLAMARHGGLFVLQDLIRPVKVVKETKRIAELLSEFQREKIQIAIVQNARGETAGLVTIEDLLEEIVGEIYGEKER